MGSAALKPGAIQLIGLAGKSRTVLHLFPALCRTRHISLVHSSLSSYFSPSVLICSQLMHVCTSDDAGGHDRRWHLLFMVTPARGGPCGRASGREKLEGMRRDAHFQKTPPHTGGSHTLLPRWTVTWKCFGCEWPLIIHADFECHPELSLGRTGHFFLSLCKKTLMQHFPSRSSVTTAAAHGGDVSV